MSILKIGVVEDELVIGRTIVNTLNELGYLHCGPAISYTEAIEMLEQDKPDLLLLDIQLSGKKDGIDVAEKLNELYQVPFIFLTANSDGETIDRPIAPSPRRRHLVRVPGSFVSTEDSGLRTECITATQSSVLSTQSFD